MLGVFLGHFFVRAYVIVDTIITGISVNNDCICYGDNKETQRQFCREVQ